MPWTILSFPAAFPKTSAQKIKTEIEGERAPLPHSSTQRKKLRRPTIVLDTTAYICVNNLNHVTNDTPKLKYFKVLSIKGHFMLSNAFSKSMKSRRPGICFVFAYLLMLSMILIFLPILLSLKKTRLVVIADLRQNFFNAISDWFSCDFIVTVEESNWSPVFQKIGRFIFLRNKSNQSSSPRDW